MDVKIEIISSDVRTISGKRKSDGQAYEIKKQEGYLYNGRPHPERFEFTLGKDTDGNPRAPYAPGYYTLTNSSLVVNGEYKNLEISQFEMQLVRLETPRPAAVKAG